MVWLGSAHQMFLWIIKLQQWMGHMTWFEKSRQLTDRLNKDLLFDQTIVSKRSKLAGRMKNTRFSVAKSEIRNVLKDSPCRHYKIKILLNRPNNPTFNVCVLRSQDLVKL